MARLQALKPTESMVYYRGHLETDIKNSKGNYVEFLRGIQEEVFHLALVGRITLKERFVKMRKPNKFGEFETFEITE